MLQACIKCAGTQKSRIGFSIVLACSKYGVHLIYQHFLIEQSLCSENYSNRAVINRYTCLKYSIICCMAGISVGSGPYFASNLSITCMELNYCAQIEHNNTVFFKFTVKNKINKPFSKWVML